MNVTKEVVDLGLQVHEDMEKTVTQKKYCLSNEKTLQDVKNRVASVMPTEELQDFVKSDRFIPAGSILSGIKNDEYKCSLSNCYVTPIESDSIEGIMDCCKKISRTYSYRGGTGVNISILRPDGSKVNNAAKMSSGAVSFMPLFSQVTETIGQNNRRGALLLLMDIRHPDILKFIWSKSHPEDVFGVDQMTGKVPDIYGANISVGITNDFIQAVLDEEDWFFRFPDRDADPEYYDNHWDGDFDKWDGAWKNYFSMPAKEVMQQIAESAWTSGDPGVLFIDNFQEYCPGTYVHESLKPTCTNPCLPKYTVLKDGDTFRRIDDPNSETWESWKTGEKEVWEFRTDMTGVTFRCTLDHRIRLEDGSFVEAEDTIGKKIHSNLEINPTVAYCRSLGVMEVWDFRMKSGEPWNYTKEGIAIHNCGEQPIPPWSNCLLSALVLHKYVKNPWTKDARFDEDLFLKDVKKAVRALNVFSDINEDLHPLPEQREADKFGKRIGLEFTGLGDTLAMLGYKYGDEQSIVWAEYIMRKKAIAEIEASCDLAQGLGPCEALRSYESRERFITSQYIKNLDLPYSLQKAIREYGLRNTAFNTVGPTGSISIVSGNCSSGIEPIYALSYQRQTRLSDQPFQFIHKPALEWIKETENYGIDLDDLKYRLNYVESHELHWKDRINMQSAVQDFTDSSISSTVNLPNDATVQEIMDIYMYASGMGLKGVTVFRDGCKQGVLSAPSTREEEGTKQAGGMYVRELLDVERAERYRINWKGAKMYVIVSLDDEDNPVEVFVKLPREAGQNGDGYYREEMYQEKFSLWECITRLVSLHLRSGMPLKMILKQLDKSSYAMTDASNVLARVLRNYLWEEEGDQCPECGKYTYIHQGGCPTCQSCGYTNCG